MNIKLLSGKLYDYIVIAIFLFSVFFVGTFFPNQIVKEKIRKETIKHIKAIGSFYEPKIDTSSSDKYIASITKCINYINIDLPKEQHVPTSLIIAQSIVESNFGTSRFAELGNNLFGIRVWSRQGILPLKQDPSINWRIKTYTTKCKSVADYLKIINNNHHYSEFRNLRNKTKDPMKLVEKLDSFSTSISYTNHVKEILIKYKGKI